MTETSKRLKDELKNIYNYTKANGGDAPNENSPIYGKYNVVKKIIDALAKTNYLESEILRRRILKGESFEQIAINVYYSRSHLYRYMKKAETLFVEKAIEMNLVK